MEKLIAEMEQGKALLRVFPRADLMDTWLDHFVGRCRRTGHSLEAERDEHHNTLVIVLTDYAPPDKDEATRQLAREGALKWHRLWGNGTTCSRFSG